MYFIALCDPEGEYRVGIGRVTKCICADSDRPDGAEVEWLARKGWSADAAQKGFRWGANPVFQPSRVRGQIQESTEPQTSFLPIPVELTQGSTYDASKKLTDKCQSMTKLTKACVNTLHEFCTTKRPELLVTHDSESESKSDSDEGDESNEAEVESAEEDSSATSRKRSESRPTPNKNEGRKRTSKG